MDGFENSDGIAEKFEKSRDGQEQEERRSGANTTMVFVGRGPGNGRLVFTWTTRTTRQDGGGGGGGDGGSKARGGNARAWPTSSCDAAAT